MEEKTFRIGGVVIPHRTVLGPMAGVTDLPFRLLAKEQGAGLVVTEMISAKAITYHNRSTAALMVTREEERPLSLQLFGHEPEVMAEAVRMIEDVPYDILDLNMGCPMPKITGNGEGSALMLDPALIERIVRACVSATKRPVTVKLRKGYDAEHVNVLECARAAEAGGASAIAVHGRTRPQMYGGTADWEAIARVCAGVSVPVIGNGDVTDGESAARMLAETGCAAVMIARRAQGYPWIFREVNAFLEEGSVPPPPTAAEIAEMAIRHTALMRSYKSERVLVQEMRKHIGWYFQGFPGAAALRKRVNGIQEYSALMALLEEVRGASDANFR